MNKKRGFIHLYTGNGKGKTTAALGLALRAAGAGKKVFIAQFVKGKPYSEMEAIRKHLPGMVIKQFGLGCFIIHNPTQKDIDAAKSGLREAGEVIRSGKFDVIILDEACIALYFNLFSFAEFKEVLKSGSGCAEIIITGRYAPDELVEMADLVTEMKEIKHYYHQGVIAREGIEY
jgi:cob(I)alamin adenosyltransferase